MASSSQPDGRAAGRPTTAPSDAPERPRTDHAQDERHPQGWRVNPAPDGRGSRPPQPARGWLTWRLVLVFLVLLLINTWLVSLLGPGGVQRLGVPYSPVFIQQVRAGNVVSISSKGSTLQGEFGHAVRYPPTDAAVKLTTHFKTEVPTFATPSSARCSRPRAWSSTPGRSARADPSPSGAPAGPRRP